MNILLINHYAGSPAHGMEYRPYYLAREWVGGHSVQMVRPSYSHVRSRARRRGAAANETIAGIDSAGCPRRPTSATASAGSQHWAFLRRLWRESRTGANSSLTW